MKTTHIKTDLRETVMLSIIMPVYNREIFLESAFESIAQQTFENWELIVVDDGSTDNSFSLASALSEEFRQRSTIVKQENAGPAAARNAGINISQGSFIAFFDSDDLWKPHHLSNCINAFQSHPELSWVYAACERVDYFTGKCLLTSTFYDNKKPNKLFSIATKQSDGLYILDQDKAVLLQLTEGLDNGLQNSVLRKEVFDIGVLPNFRVGEDRLFIIIALKNKVKMGFIDDIHVRYHVHDGNISDTNKEESDYKKRIRALEALIVAKESLPNLVNFTASEMKVFKDKLSAEIFWELGYSLYQASGDYKSAMRAYNKAIIYSPFHFNYYKTAFLTLLKALLKPFKIKSVSD